MLKFLRNFLALIALINTSTVIAHPGQHAALSWSELAEHFLSSPYHSIGLVVMGVLIAAVVIWRVTRS